MISERVAGVGMGGWLNGVVWNGWLVWEWGLVGNGWLVVERQRAPRIYWGLADARPPATLHIATLHIATLHIATLHTATLHIATLQMNAQSTGYCFAWRETRKLRSPRVT